MKSTLLIDAGSTKMEWVFLDGKEVAKRLITPGFNPNYADIQTLDNIVASTSFQEVPSIHYYGTGCGSKQNCMRVKEVLQNHFPQATIDVTHDLMGACHALFGHEKGIACILGTGANGCLYDGHEITEKAVSLGYLVGDEGSGCYIGRKLTRAYFYELMPADLRMDFDHTYHLTVKEFIDKVYHQPEPSRFLADFTKFAGAHQDHPYIRLLVKSCFNDFLEVFVLRYKDCRSLPVGFVGSVAFAFQPLLGECLNDHGLTLGKVMRSPMEGLIQMYS